MGVINKIIGTHSERELKRHKHTLDKVLALKPEMEKLTDDEMKAMEALDTGKATHNPEDPVNETRLMGLKIHD